MFTTELKTKKKNRVHPNKLRKTTYKTRDKKTTAHLLPRKTLKLEIVDG